MEPWNASALCADSESTELNPGSFVWLKWKLNQCLVQKGYEYAWQAKQEPKPDLLASLFQVCLGLPWTGPTGLNIYLKIIFQVFLRQTPSAAAGRNAPQTGQTGVLLNLLFSCTIGGEHLGALSSRSWARRHPVTQDSSAPRPCS